MAKRAVQLQPRSADAHCLLGQCLVRAARNADDINAAVASFNQSLDVQDDYQWALLMLSNLYLATGDLVKATQHADRAVKAHPDSFWVHYVQAQIYGSLKRYDEAIASANRAKELAHEVSAIPYILAGQLLYTQEKMDEGKQEYVQASKIHPTNLDARLGIGKYYELKQDAKSALVEYGRVDVDMPDNPTVKTCMARCYNNLKQYDDALKTYSEVLTRCSLTGRTPQLEVFLTMGQICSDVKQKPDLALDVYVKGLTYYGASPSGSDLHLKMAAIFRERKMLGITYSHVSRALTLNYENEECKKQLAARDLPRLSFEDILFLVQKQQYPDGIVADMILHTPLNFQKTADELNKLVKEGLPLAVGQAIFDSNKKYPPEQNEGAPAVADARGRNNQNPNAGENPEANQNPAGNENPENQNPGDENAGNENPAENPDPGQNEMPAEENQNEQGNENEGGNPGDAHPAEIIGKWVAQLQTMNGDLTMTVVFGKNGQYSIRSELATGQSQTDEGMWSVQGPQLIFRSNNGRVEVDQWRMAGRVLEVGVQNAGTIRLNKQR
jgi:tetratricopeptide (TPR) repeat protein